MTSTLQHRGWILGIRQRATSVALALAIVLVPAVVATRSAQAQTQTPTNIMLYSFTGGADGASPYGGLVRDAAGNLYGTTEFGGAVGFGTVFKLDNTGKETVLHTFAGGADGANPYADLVRDAAGNLYGTTLYGGNTTCGCGTVFKLNNTGKETVLHSFAGGADGARPYARLVRDAAGNFYGTTNVGGASNVGTVFKLDHTGKETVLYSFTGGADGAYPYARLVRDAAGNFYGTTFGGGASNGGTMFKLDNAGKETVLYSFTGGADGKNPFAGLVRDAAGNLYGTTELAGNTTCNTPYGCGTVFKLDNTGKGTVLHSFAGGADGKNPTAGLVRDAAGNFYGTTFGGGASNGGTVFKLDNTGKETVLHSFTGGTDGDGPFAGLVRDAAGNFYGTTSLGGAHSAGVVFKQTP